MKQFFDNKKILILGFGKEGRSTLKFINSLGVNADITVSDLYDIDDKEEFDVKFICGTDYQKQLQNYDMVIKSPGIVLESPSKDVIKKITSQTEIFLNFYRHKTLGITGTKGKSTTTTLIYHILSKCGIKAALVGNIGTPVFDSIKDINDNDVVVYEMSCHQLEYTDFSPHIALLLNLYEDHIDHYGTVSAYHRAKENIYRFQTKEDIFISSPECKKQIKESCARTIIPKICGKTVFCGEKSTDINEEDTKLIGQHNLFDIAAAFCAVSLFDISAEDFKKALSTYTPLPHRLEFVKEVGGVKYYDDSISTVGKTAINALLSVKNVGTVLLGGMERNIDYSDLVEFLCEFDIDNIVLMPDSGIRIGKQIEEACNKKGKRRNLIYASGLKEAVEKAAQLTVSGKSVVLSPASASYGFFKNFEERGDVFKALVNNLK